MKSFLKFLFLLALCVLGVGLARGWFSVSKTPDTESNKININVTVDPDKVKQDAEQVKELPNKLQQEAKQPGESAPEETPDPR